MAHADQESEFDELLEILDSQVIKTNQEVIDKLSQYIDSMRNII